MIPKFTGLDRKIATFYRNSNVTTPGQIVKMTSSNTVAKCTSGDIPIGIVVSLNNDYAAVQIGGYFEVSHNGSLAVGWNKISAVSDTSIKLDDLNGRSVLVLTIANHIAGIVL